MNSKQVIAGDSVVVKSSCKAKQYRGLFGKILEIGFGGTNVRVQLNWWDGSVFDVVLPITIVKKVWA